MSIDETRELGIEFERRLNSVDIRTTIDDKPDTETIYAYLNRAQDVLIKTYYLADSQLPTGSRPTIRIEKILSELIKGGKYVPKSGSENNKTAYLVHFIPDPNEDPGFNTSDIMKYIRSLSVVKSTYNWTGSSENIDDVRILKNIDVKQSDADAFILNAFDTHRIIRLPMVQFEPTDLIMYKDVYTQVNYVSVFYYRNPNKFSILNNTACELSTEAFDDLVNEALSLYVREKYKISLNEQPKEQEKQEQQKQQDEDNQAEE